MKYRAYHDLQLKHSRNSSAMLLNAGAGPTINRTSYVHLTMTYRLCRFRAGLNPVPTKAFPSAYMYGGELNFFFLFLLYNVPTGTLCSLRHELWPLSIVTCCLFCSRDVSQSGKFFRTHPLRHHNAFSEAAMCSQVTTIMERNFQTHNTRPTDMHTNDLLLS